MSGSTRDIIQKYNKTRNLNYIFLFWTLSNYTHRKIWLCKEDFHYSVSKHSNEITKVRKNHIVFKKKKWIKKWRVIVLRISWRFCGCFKKHSTGKHKENLRTVYNLFDHSNIALSSDLRHLKTLLATRSVFHLFWRWQPVADALFHASSHEMLLC